MSYGGHGLADDAEAMRLVVAALAGDATAYGIALADVGTDPASCTRLVDALANLAAHFALQPAGVWQVELRRDTAVAQLRLDLREAWDRLAVEGADR